MKEFFALVNIFVIVVLHISLHIIWFMFKNHFFKIFFLNILLINSFILLRSIILIVFQRRLRLMIFNLIWHWFWIRLCIVNLNTLDIIFRIVIFENFKFFRTIGLLFSYARFFLYTYLPCFGALIFRLTLLNFFLLFKILES